MRELITINKSVQDCISHIDDKSSGMMSRARVYFKNGHELSVIRGQYSYGGDEGLFEITLSDPNVLDKEDSCDDVLGYLTIERVNYYIEKIGGL